MAMQSTYPLWVSHSSINDFLQCPRSYFLRHVYKDPKTKKKINIISPALALGNVVHEVLENLYELPAEDRFKQDLLSIFNASWVQVTGKAGGFKTQEQEQEYKKRGEIMIQRVINNPGPLVNKAVKLHSSDELPPRYLLSKEANILLCGKVDWLEYIPEDNSVHIIDFKTGTHDERPDSLQLPIYCLLVKNCQKRTVKKISYWYLETDNTPRSLPLPDTELAEKAVLGVAKQIQQLRLLGNYKCSRLGGCFACRPFENIINGKATFIRTSGYQDIYANI